MTSSTTINRPQPSGLHLARLRAAVRGAVLTPDQAAFGDAIRAWNLNAVHRPAVAVLPVDTDDVAAAVRWAARAGIGVGVQATGHGTGRPCDGGLLLNTRLLQRVGIDPDRRRARVAAGVVWRDVVEAAAPYGLAGLPGSSATVGVVGSTLGGGFGWLGRRFGLAAHSVSSAEVVTAEGSVLRVSRDRHADLHWAVPGGLSGLGVVTGLEFALHPVPTVYAGNLFYPHERLADLLTFFADWSRTVPDALTAAVTVRRFPPAPTVPEPLRGRVLVALRGCWSGDRRDRGRAPRPGPGRPRTGHPRHVRHHACGPTGRDQRRPGRSAAGPQPSRAADRPHGAPRSTISSRSPARARTGRW